MCLSIPARVIEIEGDKAKVSVGGTIVEAGLHLVDNISIGDYVLVHTGFAIQKISELEAKETLEIFKEFEDLNRQMDIEEGKQ